MVYVSSNFVTIETKGKFMESFVSKSTDIQAIQINEFFITYVNEELL